MCGRPESDPQANLSQDPPGCWPSIGLQPSLANVYYLPDIRYISMGLPAAVLHGMGTLPAG